MDRTRFEHQILIVESNSTRHDCGRAALDSHLADAKEVQIGVVWRIPNKKALLSNCHIRHCAREYPP